jgi:GH18 family chitinase
MGRECLWQQAKHANTDGTYTIIHWSFVDIDPNTWKPVLNDPHKQWSGFKSLKNIKRVVSFGGWAYSTEPATYNIIRQAIINNRETFATNLAKFADDEGIDGIDIDWEYPGAPDILVDGKPIGQEGDGVAYLKFLTTLKNRMTDGKTVSIAAPASFWYLKAFPIDRIAKVIDYIVYMTYDLHGQWDYGNPNAFDQCDSGKCIRSHVNLTETRNSLSIITKAGVDNNQIFVGESSYGRSFRMARSGCWGPMCEFTGSRVESDAKPGRCTNTSGYLANAEIMELLKYGSDVRTFRDPSSDSDVLLYGNDYVSYMTQKTKLERRSTWKGLNFGGTIDWAVDLQAFGDDDLNNIGPIVDQDGGVCVIGEDLGVDSGDLCEFSCALGFCPAPLCHCRWRDDQPKLPKARDFKGIIAWDEFDAGLGRLCRFACKYGFCPKEICGTPVYDDEDEDGDSIEGGYDYRGAREQNAGRCLIYKSGKSQVGLQQCRNFCYKEIEEAKDEGLYANYGCGGLWPVDEELPWQKQFGGEVIVGNCTCNNWIVNELAEIIVDALPAIFQVSCLLTLFLRALELLKRFYSTGWMCYLHVSHLPCTQNWTSGVPRWKSY